MKEIMRKCLETLFVKMLFIVVTIVLTADALGVEATPNPLDFGYINIDQTISKDVLLENPANQPITIQRGYLVRNTDFNLETNLDNQIIPSLGSIEATVSVNKNEIGEITDTLIVITQYQSNFDTLKIPVIAHILLIDTGGYTFPVKVHICDTFHFWFPVGPRECGNNYILDATEFEGPNKNLFSYTTDVPLPVKLFPGDWVIFSGIFDPSGEALGLKTASFMFTQTSEFYGFQSIRIVEFIVEVVDSVIEITPNSLDFGNINVNQNDTKNVRLKNDTYQDKVIKTGYLQDGTDFNLETNLDNQTIEYLLSILARVSINTNKIGIITDTLIIIIEYLNCEDTLRVPIIANVSEAEKIDTVGGGSWHYMAHKCEDRFVEFTFKGNTCQSSLCGKTITVLALNIEGAGFTIQEISPAIPAYLGDDDTLSYWVAFTPDGTVGNKTATIYITVTGEGKTEVFKIDVYVNVYEYQFAANPNPVDFGDIYTNQTSIQNTTIYGSWATTGYLLKNTDFNLETNLNNVQLWNGLDVRVSVNTSAVGEITDTLVIITEYQHCIDTFKVPIIANVKERPITDIKFTIWADTLLNIAPTTRNFRVPIRIKADRNISGTKIEKLVVEVDRNLYFPRRVEPNTVGMNLNFIDSIIEMTFENITVPALSADEQKILLTIQGDVILGNKNSSEIRIDTVIFAGQPQGIDHTVETVNGFISLEICEDGGDRLLTNMDYEPSLTIKNHFASNNFVTKLLEVECKTIEVGNYSLEIIDLLGGVNRVKEWTVNIDEERIFDFEIPVITYGNGTYLLIMHTPSSAKFLQKFIIRK